MIVGLILVGTVLGSTAGITALLLGASVWIALVLYVATGAVILLILAMSIALRPDPQDSGEQADSYALAGPQRG